MRFSYLRPFEIPLLPFVNHMHCLHDAVKTNRMLDRDKHLAGLPASQPGKDEAIPQPARANILASQPINHSFPQRSKPPATQRANKSSPRPINHAANNHRVTKLPGHSERPSFDTQPVKHSAIHKFDQPASLSATEPAIQPAS